MARLFQLVDVYGLRIVDMGGGVGKFTVAAMINGAGSAIGYELPGNIAQKLIFDAATSRIQLPTTRPAQWIPKDIDEVFFLFIKLFTSPFNSFLSLFADAQTSRHDRIRLFLLGRNAIFYSSSYSVLGVFMSNRGNYRRVSGS